MSKAVMQQALDALELSRVCYEYHVAAAMCTAPRVSAERMCLEHKIDVATHNEKLAHEEACTALREALAQSPQENEKVCKNCGSDCNERDELTKAEREIAKLREAQQGAQHDPINAELLDACKRARLAMAAASQGDADFLGEYQKLDAVIAKAEMAKK